MNTTDRIEELESLLEQALPTLKLAATAEARRNLAPTGQPKIRKARDLLCAVELALKKSRRHFGTERR